MELGLLVGGEVEEVEEGGEGFGGAGVFAGVLGEFAGGAVEGPGFGDLHGYEFHYDIHRFNAGEVVGEVGAYAE